MNEAGEVIETLLTEVKQTAEVTKGTLGLDKTGNYGGSIQRALNTAERLKNTSVEQLQAEFQAITEGQLSGNLKNALYTTTDKVTQGAKDLFNYVYVVAADGAVTAVKYAETFVAGSVDIPLFGTV